VRAYLVTTGAAFALLALAHVARLFDEGTHLVREPIFLLTTIAAIGVCVWAVLLLKQLTRSGS
jgi:hypothetical protein